MGLTVDDNVGEVFGGVSLIEYRNRTDGERLISVSLTRAMTT